MSSTTHLLEQSCIGTEPTHVILDYVGIRRRIRRNIICILLVKNSSALAATVPRVVDTSECTLLQYLVHFQRGESWVGVNWRAESAWAAY
jgi:hypothetical protein